MRLAPPGVFVTTPACAKTCFYDADVAPDVQPARSSPLRISRAQISPQNELGSNTFHDVQVRWNAPWNATVAIGANNVFEHFSAPTVQQRRTRATAYYGGFDIGRFMYLKYQQRF